MTVSAMKAALSLLAAVIKIKTFITQSSQSSVRVSCPDLTHRDHPSSHAQICLKFTETNIIQMRTEKVSFTESVKTEQIFKIFNIGAFSL